MKHFFDQSIILDDATLSELLRAARRELKQKPMNLAEMSTKMDLICFNASATDQYIPRGMDSLITTKNMPLGQKIPKEVTSDLEKLISLNPGDVFGYLLGNIQTKAIFNYLDILFTVKDDYRFRPQVVAHFSYPELIEYLIEFLNSGVVDGTKRKIDVFDDKSARAWKTIVKANELKSVDQSIRVPLILDRPFFNDIKLNISKGGKPQIVDSSFGKLKSVIGYFSRYRTPSGEIISSNNKLFFRPKDIHSIKVSSTQSKALLGISHKGEYVASAQFISHDIGLKHILFKDIDFFTFKINKKATDITPDQIIRVEVNIDTQQVVFERGVSNNEFHVARFNKLKLYRDDQPAFIHKVVPFNRGSANFEQIQTFFATRYTEFEKAQHILTARGELGLLSNRNICSGDLITQVALSSMHQLGLLPFEAKCVGFSPMDIKNTETSSNLFQKEVEELQGLFKEIVDVSKSPDFTEHNFDRLSKNMRDFVAIRDTSAVSPEVFEKLIEELEKLIEYMDNFFKLDIYKDLHDDLECEQVNDFDEPGGEHEIMLPEENSRIDSKTKQFISENYSFFQKRDLVQKALLKIEKVMFYNNKVKPSAENQDFEPDMIVYKSDENQVDNFLFASYPSYSLSKVLDPGILHTKDEVEELLFIKFMRDFTRKTFHKAQELNKSFHHQYKHTLSELAFNVDEKLRQLTNELELLELPENREKAYQELLDKITKMFNQHLKDKEQNIEGLRTEEKRVQKSLTIYKKELEKLIGEEIEAENLDNWLESMPEMLETMKKEVIEKHKVILNKTSPIFNSYVKLYNAALHYFNKVLGYAPLFQKALWMHRHQKMVEEVKARSKKYLQLESSEISSKIKDSETFQADDVKRKQLAKEVSSLIEELKETLVDLKDIPSKELFQSPKKAEDKLSEYLDYYRNESFRLTKLAGMLQTIYVKMNRIQNQLFKKQEELVQEELKSAEHEFTLKVLTIIRDNPEAKESIENLNEQIENIPKEIKDELGNLRAILIEALNTFKATVVKEKLIEISDYRTFFIESKKRDKTNDLAKELVNFSQGIKAIGQEIGGEIKDLEYLKTQESELEKIAMSKALPSTRVLLKTQYIPMVEREKKILDRANRFLAEIISKEEQIINGLTSTFFKKRHGFPQFCKGSFCIDTTKGTKDHTEKNINAAYLLLSERIKKGCVTATKKVDKIELSKAEILGVEGLRNRISQIWHGHVNDRFLCLSPSLSLEEVLELCEYKDTICQSNPKPQRSRNSLILIYIQKIEYNQIKANPNLVERYNQAILSNIFVNIDDSVIYNNRDSIFEGLIRGTFGAGNDAISDQIMQTFLHAG